MTLRHRSRARATRGGAALAGLLIAVGLFAHARDARASGLFFADRGVRPLARGGAFVGGADDGGAIWYNPAGLADAGTTVLADFSWLHFTSDYTRRTQVTDTAGTVRVYEFPTVQGSTPILPIPTVAGTYQFGENKEYTLALGLLAPYTAIASYPEAVNGSPSPSRYSLVSLDGSALVVAGAWFAMKPADWVRLGAGIEMMTGTFQSTVVFSACPADRLVCAAEDPQYDSFSALKVGPIFSPSANLGATFLPSKDWRIGISVQAPFHVDAPATVNVRLPTAPEFDHASQQGADAHVRFNLPAIFRIGVETRPTDDLRLEVAYVREFWSNHSSIDIVPDNIKLLNVTGFPSPYAVSPISIPRNFQDSNSVRLGSEYTFRVGGGEGPENKNSGYKIDLRAGVNFEQSAIPVEYVSPLTIDAFKITPAIGGGIYIGDHWRLDAVYAHVFASTVEVAPDKAAVPRVNPVKGNPTATEAVNGGTYNARADILGVGLRYLF